MPQVDIDVLVGSCLFWLAVGWSWGFFSREQREKRREKRRFERMIRR
jgi:hypothetical protein